MCCLMMRHCCFAGAKIQQAIAARLKGYPQKAHRQMQRAKVILPAKVAAVLHANPGQAGPAVDAFYNRDVDDMRAAARMRHFAPQVLIHIAIKVSWVCTMGNSNACNILI